MNRILALAPVIVLLLMGGNVAFASAPQHVPLALSMTGGIGAAGDQHYVLAQDGVIAYASIFGKTIKPHSSSLDYSLVADVHGLSVSGHANVHLVASSLDGQKVVLNGKVVIQGMVPAEVFTSGAIPSAFLGLLTGTVTIGRDSETIALPVSLESPFINPFGGPIVLATLDVPSSIVLVTDYNVAKIQYSNVQLFTLSVTGKLGQSPVTAGSAALTTRSIENLVRGTETETGSIAFTGMTPSLLDSSGHYSGSSIIPSENQCLSTYGFEPCTLDCTAYLPLLMGAPSLDLSSLPTGLCTITGFISSGSFNSVGAHVVIRGTYTTVWDVPAVTFGCPSSAVTIICLPPPLGGSTITGTVMG